MIRIEAEQEYLIEENYFNEIDYQEYYIYCEKEL